MHDVTCSHAITVPWPQCVGSHRLCVDSCLHLSVHSFTDMSIRLAWHVFGMIWEEICIFLHRQTTYINTATLPIFVPSFFHDRLSPLHLPNLFGSTHRYRHLRSSRYVSPEVILHSCSSDSTSNIRDACAKLIRLQNIYSCTSMMAPAVESDAFLACCVRHCKEKPQIDWKEVSHELGMSEGGAK